jgi:hypothetical protein
VTNLPAALRGWRAQLGYINAAHRVQARVEDRILPRTGKDCSSSGPRPSSRTPEWTNRLRVLGPDHPHTLATRDNFAHWQEQAREAISKETPSAYPGRHGAI